MAIIGRIFLTLGVVSLLLAAWLLFTEVTCDPGNGGFAICLPNLLYPASAILAVLGALGIVCGWHMIREVRELHKFNRAMEANNGPKND